MARLTFEYNENVDMREASSISMEVPDDMDIYEYRVMCMRLASTLGYHPESIKRAFGEESDVGISDDEILGYFNGE